MSVQRIKLTFGVLAFCQSFAMGLPMGLIFLFVQARGVSLLEIGGLLAVQAGTVVLLELPTGGLADVWGRKKVLLLSFVAGTLGMTVVLFSFTFFSFALAMVLSGAARALYSGTAEAMFVDTLKTRDPEVNLQKGLSTFLMASGLGMGIGALLGGFIPVFFPRVETAREAIFTPLAMPIAFSCVAWLLLSLGAALWLREPPSENGAASEHEGLRAVADVVAQSLALGLKNRLILVLISAVSLTSLAFSSIEAFWQPRFAALQGSAETDTRAFGAIFFASFVISAFGAGLAGLLARLTGNRYALANAVSTLLLGVAVFVFSVQGQFAAAVAGFCGVYLMSGLNTTIFQALFNDTIPSEKRATLISCQSLAMRAGILIGGPGLGALASRFSIPYAWKTAAVILVFIIPIYVFAEFLRSRSRAAQGRGEAGVETGMAAGPEPPILPAEERSIEA